MVAAAIGGAVAWWRRMARQRCGESPILKGSSLSSLAGVPENEEAGKHMRSVVQGVVALGVGLALVGQAIAADLFVYPQKGQSPEQQNKDSYECYNWARAQSGVDPGAPPPPAQAGQHARGAVGGAARGAAVGAAVGAIAGNAGKGAAAGAVVGGVGGRRRSVAAQQQQQQTTRSAYDRAFAACMEGRGYTVR